MPITEAAPLQPQSMQFAAFSPRTEAINSAVIANGVPKSGTYLLHSIVKVLGN